MSVNTFLISEFYLLFCLEELTSAPCCLSFSYSKELVDVSMLRGTGCSASPSGISSSEKGFNLYLFSPGWSVEVAGGVSS